jgi:hypothetical protein
MVRRVLVLTIPFLFGCCIAQRHTCTKPKFKTETGVNAKFDPYNEAKPIQGIEASWKFVREW